MKILDIHCDLSNAIVTISMLDLRMVKISVEWTRRGSCIADGCFPVG